MSKPTLFMIDGNQPTNIYNEVVISTSELFRTYRIFFDAEKALVELKECSDMPDLILLDIGMPLVNGWEFVAAFEEIRPQKIAGTVIVVLTSSLSKFDREKSTQHRTVKGFIEKPLDQVKVDEILEIYKNFSNEK